VDFDCPAFGCDGGDCPSASECGTDAPTPSGPRERDVYAATIEEIQRRATLDFEDDDGDDASIVFDCSRSVLSHRVVRVSGVVSAVAGTGFYFQDGVGPLADRTFVLYVGDHGDMQGDHYLWRKGFPFEGSAHVPLIVRWPEAYVPLAASRGVALAFVTEHRDLLPTLLDAAGAAGSLEPREAVDGRSLLDLLRGDNATWRSWVDLEHDPGTLGAVCFDNTTNHWNALTDGSTTKYVFDAHTLEEFLFDLPGERENLAAAQPERLALWRRRLVAHFEDEKRGDAWVKGGVLQRRTGSILYSPFYPADVPGRAFDGAPRAT